MPGMMSMGRALVGKVEAFDKAMKSVGKSRVFDGKLHPLLKDYVAVAVQLDEATDAIGPAHEDAEQCFRQVAAIKADYRDSAKRVAREESAMVADLDRFMKLVTPESAKSQNVRKAWQAFKKDYPSFVAARPAKMDFGPTLDAYAKKANAVEVLAHKAEGLKPELIKAYLKFIACARNYEAIIEKEQIDPRLPAGFRKIIAGVTEEHKGLLGNMKAAA